MYNFPCMAKSDQFFSPSKGYLTPSEVVMEIEGFVNEFPESFYRLVIGSDSQNGPRSQIFLEEGQN